MASVSMFAAPGALPSGRAPAPAPTPTVSSGFVYPGIGREFTPTEKATIVPPTPPANIAQNTVAPAAPAGPTSAQLAQPLAALSHLDEILGNKNSQSHDEYQKAIDSYNTTDTQDSQAHAQQVQQNEQTLAKNNQASLLNAVNSGTGLRGVLSSLGGLAGSGSDIVNRLIGLAANSDAGAARQTFDSNATNLNDAWRKTDQAEKQRRADADSLLQNNLQNNQANVLTSKQTILQKLADLFGTGDARGNDYATQAASLEPQIAATTHATVAPYQAASSLFSPGALQSYLAGTQNLNVSTAAGSPTAPAGPAINSPGYAPSKKDALSGVA